MDFFYFFSTKYFLLVTKKKHLYSTHNKIINNKQNKVTKMNKTLQTILKNIEENMKKIKTIKITENMDEFDIDNLFIKAGLETTRNDTYKLIRELSMFTEYYKEDAKTINNIKEIESQAKEMLDAYCEDNFTQANKIFKQINKTEENKAENKTVYDFLEKYIEKPYLQKAYIYCTAYYKEEYRSFYTIIQLPDLHLIEAKYLDTNTSIPFSAEYEEETVENILCSTHLKEEIYDVTTWKNYDDFSEFTIACWRIIVGEKVIYDKNPKHKKLANEGNGRKYHDISAYYNCKTRSYTFVLEKATHYDISQLITDLRAKYDFVDEYGENDTHIFTFYRDEIHTIINIKDFFIFCSAYHIKSTENPFVEFEEQYEYELNDDEMEYALEEIHGAYKEIERRSYSHTSFMDAIHECHIDFLSNNRNICDFNKEYILSYYYSSSVDEVVDSVTFSSVSQNFAYKVCREYYSDRFSTVYAREDADSIIREVHDFLHDIFCANSTFRESFDDNIFSFSEQQAYELVVIARRIAEQ